MEEMGNNLKNIRTRNLICEQVTLPSINPPNHNIVAYNFHGIPYSVYGYATTLLYFGQYRPYMM